MLGCFAGRIYKSLLKNGYSNFSLEILEYCAPEKCIKREQHYLNLLKPEYNILNTAGSLLGFKHSNETKAKIFAYLKTLYANLKFKAKRLEQLKRLRSNPEQQAKRLEHSYASKVKRVSVLDTKKNETTIYPSAPFFGPPFLGPPFLGGP